MPKRDLVTDRNCANANHQVRTSLRLPLSFFSSSSLVLLSVLFSISTLYWALIWGLLCFFKAHFGLLKKKKKNASSSSSHDLRINFQP